MFKAFVFWLWDIKTISPLINRSINEALLVADHVSIRCCFSSLTFLINMFLRVGFSQCIQALVHWCGFHAARVTANSAYYCVAAQTVNARHRSRCWRLVLSSAPRRHKSTELRWHERTLDSGLYTRFVASQQITPQFSRLHDMESFRNAFIRNSKGCQTSSMSCCS